MQISKQYDQIAKMVNQRSAEREILRKQSDDLESKIKKLKRRHLNAKKARALVQDVAQQTQEALQFHISDIVSTALAAVFDQPYEFVVEFVQKRNKTECELWFVKDGEQYDPMLSSGGGPLDVASFALRVAIWTMSNSRNTITIDEPFKFVSVDLQPKCSEMVKMLSEKLNIQFIIVSHLQDMIESADKVFVVDKGNVTEH